MPFTLKKRDRITAAVNTRVRKRNSKFGIQIPASIAESKAMDQNNGNKLWKDAIAREMFEVGVAFKVLSDNKHLPVGYTESSETWYLTSRWSSPEKQGG